jgi:DNA-binding response OmpR family regulator
MKKTRVLVVEDDSKMQSLLRAELGLRDFEVSGVDNGPEAVRTFDEAALGESAFDLLLIDISLRIGNGLDVCRAIRSASSVPVIFVSATDDPRVKIAALQSGADDYVTKPFYMGELLARMRAVLRRANPETDAEGDAETSKAPSSSRIAIDDLTIDLDRHTVTRRGADIALTRTEYFLLRELVLHPDRVLTYEHLFRAVWGERSGDVRAVHVHVSHLRRKVESPPSPRTIVSVPGVGYRFRPKDEP